jgi:hypothetical protein
MFCRDPGGAPRHTHLELRIFRRRAAEPLSARPRCAACDLPAAAERRLEGPGWQHCAARHRADLSRVSGARRRAAPRPAVDELQFLAYLKPFNSELPHDHRDNYYAEREWRYDISVNFALSDVRAVVVHPDFAGRCAADFRELGDRLRPSRCKQVCRRFQSALPRSTRTPAAMFCPVGIVSMRRAYARPLTASRRKCRADVQMQKALRVAGLSAALPLRLSSLCA